MFSFQGDSFTVLSVSRSDNGRPVSCQALTPFTKIYPDTGRSDTRFVKVLRELPSYSHGYILIVLQLHQLFHFKPFFL